MHQRSTPFLLPARFFVLLFGNVHGLLPWLRYLKSARQLTSSSHTLYTWSRLRVVLLIDRPVGFPVSICFPRRFKETHDHQDKISGMVKEIEVDPLTGHYPAPYSLSPLGPVLKKGLLAPGLLGLLSVVTTLGLLSFLIYRFTTWRQHYRTYVGYNQYVVLCMNL